MYHFGFGLSFLKSFTPYLRKTILNTLNSHDLLYLNALVYFLIVFLFFLYKLIFDKSKSIIETIENYKNLTILQVICLFSMSFIAVLSSIFIFEFDKNHNTPLINSVFMKSFSTIALIFIGIFLFEEKYSWKQILGVFITLVGIFLILQKN